MSDKLKKFVDSQRESFEIDEQDIHSLWRNIENALDKRENKVRGLLPVLLRLAAVLFIIGTVGFYIYVQGFDHKLNENGISMGRLSPELADTEAFYSAQIDDKLARIKSLEGHLDSNVLAQIKLMDSDYSSLKKDLKDNADNQEVIDAMIDYYRLKLKMLEQILEELKNNDDKTENNKTVSI